MIFLLFSSLHFYFWSLFLSFIWTSLELLFLFLFGIFLRVSSSSFGVPKTSRSRQSLFMVSFFRTSNAWFHELNHSQPVIEAFLLFNLAQVYVKNWIRKEATLLKMKILAMSKMKKHNTKIMNKMARELKLMTRIWNCIHQGQLTDNEQENEECDAKEVDDCIIWWRLWKLWIYTDGCCGILCTRTIWYLWQVDFTGLSVKLVNIL